MITFVLLPAVLVSLAPVDTIRVGDILVDVVESPAEREDEAGALLPWGPRAVGQGWSERALLPRSA